MTVKELIEELQKFDPSIPVWTMTAYDDCGEVVSVHFGDGWPKGDCFKKFPVVWIEP